MTDTVLVTGGSGFVAGWCIERLLNAGYSVSATVRDLKKAPAARAQIAALSPHAADTGRLAFFAADLTADDGWAQAVEGCRYVLHVASPLSPPASSGEDAYIRPAREGTLRVMKAAVEAGVERVVITSSMAAIAYGHPKARHRNGPPFTGDDWTNPAGGDTSAYVRSKTFAEKAAWDFIAEHGGKTQLAVVNPAGIFGPAMGPDYSESLAIVARLLNGKMPGLPPIGFCVVDVRDLADLHLLAMTRPEAAGKRYPAGGQFLWFQDIADILREELPSEMTAKVPTRTLPAPLLRIIALWDVQVRQLVHSLNLKREMSQDAALALGWRPRSPEESLKDTALSLRAVGAV
ncbi:aldehyde reductase [soil metagenome]